jgi:hypothetical protein
MASPTAVAPDPAGAAAKAVAPSARETARETAPSSRQGTSSSRPPKPPNPFASDADYLGPISATPQKMVSVMLRVAGVQEGDVVFDLGCNDGRVPITAAVEFGATGVGVEIDEGAVSKARRLATEAGVSDRVTILAQNAVKTTGLEKATVVFVYLLPKGNAKISRKLMRETRPGTTGGDVRLPLTATRVGFALGDGRVREQHARPRREDTGRRHGSVQQGVPVPRAGREAAMVPRKHLRTRRSDSLGASATSSDASFSRVFEERAFVRETTRRNDGFRRF